MKSSDPFGIIILAAGASTRLGRPKQLLSYKDKTLVEHVTQAALGSEASEVVIVVGFEAEAMRNKLNGLVVSIVENPEWKSGMASSIRCGLLSLRSDIKCVVIALCDQPHVTPELFRKLAVRHFETGAEIVASSYDGILGAPCAFGEPMYPSLLALAGDAGARELIRKSPTPVECVASEGGRVDVDTIEDVQALQQST